MRNIVLILVQLSCIAAYAESPPLTGMPFQRADLDVRWNASTNPWPSTLWTYRVEATNFSAAVISNLMALGSFTDEDKANPFGKPDPRCFYFANMDKSRTLLITPGCRAVEYDDHKVNKALAGEDAPESNAVLRLATTFLPKLGIRISELETKPQSSELRTRWIHQEGVIFTNNAFVTNIQSRGVLFFRSVDGVEVLGGRTSSCRIEFGNRGRISHISLLWPRWERVRAYPTVEPTSIVEWIRHGKAVLCSLPADIPPIDWPMVKSVTITGAEPFYSGDAKNVLKARIYPYVALTASIDTGQTNVEAEIHCPVIDDTKTAATINER
jgi:hypothetical protein